MRNNTVAAAIRLAAADAGVRRCEADKSLAPHTEEAKATLDAARAEYDASLKGETTITPEQKALLDAATHAEARALSAKAAEELASRIKDNPGDEDDPATTLEVVGQIKAEVMGRE